MRDDYYRGYVDYPPDYDGTINLIKLTNRYAGETDAAKEEFASNSVNECIRSVIFGDVGAWCSTGGCLAVRVSADKSNPGYKKVLLAIRPPNS